MDVFGKTLFNEVLSTDYIYSWLDEIGKNVLGTNILSHLFWKFFIDEGKMVLFSKKDSVLIQKEIAGYIKIENGLLDNKITFTFPPSQEGYKFTLDLSYNGDIEINKEVFTSFSNRFPYRKILKSGMKSTNDTIFIFDEIDVQWNDFRVPACKIVYLPYSNKNFIGTKFM
jgi:hypothetical protein